MTVVRTPKAGPFYAVKSGGGETLDDAVARCERRLEALRPLGLHEIDARLNGLIAAMGGEADPSPTDSLRHSREGLNSLCGLCGLFGHDALGKVAARLLEYLDEHGLQADSRALQVYVDAMRLLRAEPDRDAAFMLHTLAKLD